MGAVEGIDATRKGISINVAVMILSVPLQRDIVRYPISKGENIYGNHLKVAELIVDMYDVKSLPSDSYSIAKLVKNLDPNTDRVAMYMPAESASKMLISSYY